MAHVGPGLLSEVPLLCVPGLDLRVHGMPTPYTWSSFGTKSSSSFSSSISLESCLSALEMSSSPETTQADVRDKKENSSFFLKSALPLLLSVLAPEEWSKVPAAPRGPLTVSSASPAPPAPVHRARQPAPNSLVYRRLCRRQKIQSRKDFLGLASCTSKQPLQGTQTQGKS